MKAIFHMKQYISSLMCLKISDELDKKGDILNSDLVYKMALNLYKGNYNIKTASKNDQLILLKLANTNLSPEQEYLLMNSSDDEFDHAMLKNPRLFHEPLSNEQFQNLFKGFQGKQKSSPVYINPFYEELLRKKKIAPSNDEENATENNESFLQKAF